MALRRRSLGSARAGLGAAGPAAERPYAARLSPKGRYIAVGFADSTTVQVLEAETLAEVARPSSAGVDNGDVSSVAWSADGCYLLAGRRASCVCPPTAAGCASATGMAARTPGCSTSPAASWAPTTPASPPPAPRRRG